MVRQRHADESKVAYFVWSAWYLWFLSSTLIWLYHSWQKHIMRNCFQKKNGDDDDYKQDDCKRDDDTSNRKYWN